MNTSHVGHRRSGGSLLPHITPHLAENGKDYVISKSEDLVGDAQTPVHVVHQEQLAATKK